MTEELNSVWYGNEEGARLFLGLHGWGGGHATFEPLLPYLPDDVGILSVDLPGYGASEKLTAWDPELVARKVLATMDAVGLERATLLGNCSGAAFGLVAAEFAPDRFERLVLIDPFAYFPWYFKLLVMPFFGPLFYWSSFGNPIGRWITNSGLAKHRTEESDLTASFEVLDHGVVYAYLRMLKAIGEYERFAGFEMPIALLHGEKTFGAILRSLDLWRSIWPQATATELRGAAHLPIEEAPEQLAAAAFRLSSTTSGVKADGEQASDAALTG